MKPPIRRTSLRSSIRQSIRRSIIGNDNHLRRLNANSIPQFRTSVRYSQRQLDYDLQKKIDLEIKMREGTSKLLSACEHMNQSLEAAKSLLTSDIRLAEFRNELQKRKSHKSKIKKSSISSAKASISDIRIPLIWKDTDYFKNKGDYRRFAVFCLLQLGTEIYDTIMIYVDRNVTDICFEDAFHFSDLNPDFQLKISVYARVMHDDLSMASTPKKLTHKISNSLSRSLGRKLANIKDDLDPELGPRFYLMASANLCLKDCSDSIKTYDLNLENVERNLQLPLFGHFCCRLAVQPQCQMKEYISGLLELRPNLRSEYGLYWCVLKGFKLNLWNVKRDLQNEPVFLKHTLSNTTPNMVVPINKQTRISQSESTMVIANNDNSCCFQCLTGSQADWFKALLSMQDDFIAWETIAEYQMDLASMAQPRPQYFPFDRLPGALYNETPIQEHTIRKRHSKSFSNVKPDRFKNNYSAAKLIDY